MHSVNHLGVGCLKNVHNLLQIIRQTGHRAGHRRIY